MGIRLGLTDEALQAGASNVWWPARMQKLASNPTTWLDGAHNPAAIDRLLKTLPEVGLDAGYTLVFGAHPKKDARPMLNRLAERAGHVWLTSADKLVPAESLSKFLPERAQVCVEPDAGAAVKAARALGKPVLVAGSLYLAGAVLSWAERAALPHPTNL
jgi:dihydrofolate synthase/folylpolyglutamate synthase